MSTVTPTVCSSSVSQAGGFGGRAKTACATLGKGLFCFSDCCSLAYFYIHKQIFVVSPLSHTVSSCIVKHVCENYNMTKTLIHRYMMTYEFADSMANQGSI